MNKDELIKKVSEILWTNEKELSDGFDFYAGGYPEAEETVNEIAEQIVNCISASNKE